MNQAIVLPDSFTSYQQAMDFINYGLPSMPGDIHAGTYGLQRVFDLLGDLGSPQNKLKVIHIAGTSGKGTTAYYIDALLRAKGMRTGLSVSPYVYDMKERWYVDGVFLDDKEILAAANTVLTALHAAHHAGRLTSRFETMICLVFVIMLGKNIDYLVLETGMGGLLDPTNTVQRSDKISVLTTIGLDHTHILGTDITSIAAHKAGIIQPKSSVLTYRQSKEVDAIFTQAAEDQAAQLQFIPDIATALMRADDPPKFSRNAVLAHAVSSEVFKREGLQPCEIEAALPRMRSVIIPGRAETVLLKSGQRILLDGAHNAQKLAALTEYVTQSNAGNDLSVVAIIAKEQQLDEVLSLLGSIAKRLIIVDYPALVSDFKHAVAPDVAVARALAMGIQAESATYEGALLAIQASRQAWLITGSFYHLAYFKKNLRK